MVQQRINLERVGETDRGAGRLVDGCPGLGQAVGRFAHGIGYLPIDGREGIVGPNSDAQALGVGPARLGQRRGGQGGVARSRDHRQGQVEIFSGAGDRPGDHQVDIAQRAPLGRRRDRTPGRDQPPARLQAEDAAGMGRPADRAAKIGAELEGAHAGGDRNRRTARRAAGRARLVPRIVGHAMGRIVALEIAGEDRDVGLADDHRAGSPQPCDCGSILSGDTLAIGRQSTR